MHVLATAGHVDHGKSTLVRALTGMEPDRWAEERARGMTIDLGYAWTTLPSGRVVGFVDVPGHARFIGNMLAGLGPAPAVVFVVAADEGWRRQSTEHLAAVHALGLRSGLLVVTRSDLADPGPALAEAAEHLSRSSLGCVPAVAVSGATGDGLDRLRTALDDLTAALPEPDRSARVRLWVDRAFTVRGSGTVVTGTLPAGTLRVGDALSVGSRSVRVRGLQSLGVAYDEVGAVARVAVNLRGVEVSEVGRGSALLTPAAWVRPDVLDVRLTADPRALPASLVLHVGTAAVAVRVRALGSAEARLHLSRRLPLQVGDRAVLRDPGAQAIAAGVVVLDADPPPLDRRGAASARGHVLAGPVPSAADEVRRRGAVRADHLAALGFSRPDDVRVVAGWLVSDGQWKAWLEALRAVVADGPAVPDDVVRQRLDLPDRGLLVPLVEAAAVGQARGRVGRADVLAPGVAVLEQRLAAEPFAAPDRPQLEELGLGRREVAAAVTAGRLVLLPPDVLLRPDAPALAVATLSALPQPFTASRAREALGTTRRVTLPLLEHLDRQGATRRIDRSLREVCGPAP